MAWHGKLLRVNLTKGTCTPEPLNMDWVKLYLGQRGLGTKYLYEEIDPKVDPLSPDNKLIFVTGPLTGTCASTGGRYSVVTKGPLTGTVACSNSGGQFGGELKQAGWDMVIIEGKSAKPVYLMLVDDQAELLDAEGFIWGETVWDTEDAIRKRHQDPLIRIASIGGAGEGLSRYACIMNDRDRAAGRSGVGAVMGSKLLKAVAVRGTTGVAVNDPKRFLDVTREKRKILDPSPARARYSGLGTMAMMDVTQAHGSLPTLNCREVQFEHIADVNVKKQHTVRKSDGEAPYQGNKACFACSIGCGRMAKIDPDHFSIKGKARYSGVTGGLEYESAYAVGPMCGVQDVEAATYASALCNEHGMDPISFGATVAAAMELFMEGAITTEQTEGRDFSFGNAEALCWAAEVTGTAQGFGKDLGLGALRLCKKIRPSRIRHGREGPGIPRLRSPRHAGHGPGLCDLEPGGLPLEGRPVPGRLPARHPGRQGQDRQGQPGLHRRHRFLGPLHLHQGGMGCARLCRPDRRRLRRRLDRRAPAGTGRAHLQPGAPVQQRRRLHRQGRHPAQAGADRTGQGRGRQGPCRRIGQDAAGILRTARLDPRWGADDPDAVPPGPGLSGRIMKVTVKLIAMDPFSPPGFDSNGIGAFTLADGASLEDLITQLKLPDGIGEAYMTMLNEDAVPIAGRADVPLSEGDEVTVFPAIKGG